MATLPASRTASCRAPRVELLCSGLEVLEGLADLDPGVGGLGGLERVELRENWVAQVPPLIELVTLGRAEQVGAQ